MAFEKHQKHSGRGGRDRAEVSLRQSGSVGINAAAYEAYFDDHEHAVLFYDPADDRVGIKPSGDDDPDAYALQFAANSKGASINAGGFLTQYGLVPERTTRFDAHWHDDKQLVYVDLHEDGSTVGDTDA